MLRREPSALDDPLTNTLRIVSNEQKSGKSRFAGVDRPIELLPEHRIRPTGEHPSVDDELRAKIYDEEEGIQQHSLKVMVVSLLAAVDVVRAVARNAAPVKVTCSHPSRHWLSQAGGLALFTQAVFVATSIGEITGDLTIALGGGFLMVAFGLLSLIIASRNHFGAAVCMLLPGIGTEVGVSLIYYNWPESAGRTLLPLTYAFQFFPLLFITVMVCCLRKLQQTPEEAEEHHKKLQKTKSFLVTATPEEVHAITTVQAKYRKRVAARRTVRMRELNAWLALRLERSLLLFLAYSFVFAFCGLGLYVNLIFGIKVRSRHLR